MARARNIKPGFFKNEDLAECDVWARLCFAGLWTLADREGRLEDRPKRIKAELFAFDSINVEPLLQELEKHGFIQRYVASESLGVIQILAFYKHQNPHHREPSSELPCHKSLGLSADENDSNQPEHEALHPSDATKAPNKTEALPPTSDPPSDTSPELAQDKPEALPSTSELSSPQIRADSGYSDSGTLIPEEKKGARKRAQPSFDASGIEVPDWLDRELWTEWVADRKERGKPITERAAKQQIATLDEFRRAGYTPERTIRHAIGSGNQGLYAPPKLTSGNGLSIRERDTATAAARVRDMTGGRLDDTKRSASDVVEMEALNAARIADR